MPNPYNKIVFTPEMHQFLKDNYLSMTNRELADALGLKLTRTRTELYKLGLKRMELEYWTKQQTQFLKDNYKDFGDTELAEIFEVKWYKAKGWTKKHIEKKRRYLKLKRTTAEKKAIQIRNTKMGRFAMCAKKRWETIGEAPIGEKRVWFTSEGNLPYVVIKTKNGFVHYNRWLWQKEKGKIPPGMNVVINTDDRINYTIKDLALISDAELSKRNSQGRVPKELKQTQQLIRKINRKIITNEKRHRSRKRCIV
jgi:hypothetical protein